MPYRNRRNRELAQRPLPWAGEKALASFICVLALSVAHVSFAAPATSEKDADAAGLFQSKIQPILTSHCIKCHGPDKQKGKLRLDTRAALLTGGESGKVITLGHPDQSLMVKAISYLDEDLKMPPKKKKLSAAQIEAIRRWIQAGAPWPKGITLRPAKESGFAESDRNYWAFRPIGDPKPPTVRRQAWAGNPIDAFVLGQLESAKIEPAPQADKQTLIRRASFDLIGLPPTPQAVDEFLADTSPDAYEKLIDRLLDSPRYGERWARHWLDLVRYADSDGFKADSYRPNAWRYRDYVIRSFNTDKPYDRFLQEQLAGDELFPDSDEAYVATGYLRLWPYENNQKDVQRQFRLILEDVTEVTGEVVMGMGMRCARCHDHKFDPISHRDYYRLQAFFAAMIPREDRQIPTGSLAPLSRWESVTHEVRTTMARMSDPVHMASRRKTAKRYPQYLQDIYAKPRETWTPLEQQYAQLAEFQILKNKKDPKFTGEQKEQWQALKDKLKEHESLKPKGMVSVMGVRDIGPDASPTFIPGGKGDPILPGFLSILDPSDATITPNEKTDSTGRRTALARWLTRPENPLTTRVIVNRIWQSHFGLGIVGTANDFGRQGQAPTHPKLLDWLAMRFIEDGYSFKKMHRRMMTSATYRQASVRPPPRQAMAADPDNRLIWKMRVRRLDAEQIRDAMLMASGQLDTRVGGPAVDDKSKRRSIYVKNIRNKKPTFLNNFDTPDLHNSCAMREITTTPLQALAMLNGDFVDQRAKAFADALGKAHGNDRSKCVAGAYQQAYGRAPDDVERRAAADFFNGDQKVSDEALVDFCHVLLNSNAFIYVD